MKIPAKEFCIQELHKRISTRHQQGRGGVGDTTIVDIHVMDDTNEVFIKVNYDKSKTTECLCVILTTMTAVSTIYLSDEHIEYVVTLIKEFCKQQKIELI
jgi:hypothetical protein